MRSCVKGNETATNVSVTTETASPLRDLHRTGAIGPSRPPLPKPRQCATSRGSRPTGSLFHHHVQPNDQPRATYQRLCTGPRRTWTTRRTLLAQVAASPEAEIRTPRSRDVGRLTIRGLSCRLSLHAPIR